MARKKKRRLKKKFYLFVIIVLALFIGVLFFLNKDRFLETVDDIVDKLPSEEVKKLEIVDVESNSRPIAIMINNHPAARKYHTGLQDAYLTYEIIVEGGYTRYMSLFKDAQLEKVGSVRSSRHYFLDYVMENDAIYVHWGWSPEAEADIEKYEIDNINGLTQEQYYFYRDNNLDVGYEHRGFTNSELINKGIKELKYKDTTNKELLFDYSVDEILLNEFDNNVVANEVVIPYSSIVTTSYKYDEETKTYKRYVNDKEHVDYGTKKQYSVKNIIVYQVSNSTLTGDVKGRQDIDNIGSGNGYYITDGYAVPIKWSKSSRSAKTVYTYEDGKEITLNDGNTFIQIYPKSKKLEIK